VSESVVFDPTHLSSLNDQHWRRLGISQTFDRLLVVAVATQPGNGADVRGAVGSSLTAGAARFWDMSFPQILKDLRRRGVITEEDGQRLGLSPDFAGRLRDVVDQEVHGRSRVEPTPGVTLEDVLRHQEERAEREKAISAARKRTAKQQEKEKKAAGAEPRRRASPPASARGHAALEEPARMPVAQLFTSQRLNRVLDTLDTAALDLARLIEKVGLSKGDMDRFLRVTEHEGITRNNGGMVELHWQGRELARTASDERRRVLIDLVKKLRERAEELGV
jgi:hypothetical protein